MRCSAPTLQQQQQQRQQLLRLLMLGVRVRVVAGDAARARPAWTATAAAAAAGSSRRRRESLLGRAYSSLPSSSAGGMASSASSLSKGVEIDTLPIANASTSVPQSADAGPQERERDAHKDTPAKSGQVERDTAQGSNAQEAGAAAAMQERREVLRLKRQRQRRRKAMRRAEKAASEASESKEVTATPGDEREAVAINDENDSAAAITKAAETTATMPEVNEDSPKVVFAANGETDAGEEKMEGKAAAAAEETKATVPQPVSATTSKTKPAKKKAKPATRTKPKSRSSISLKHAERTAAAGRLKGKTKRTKKEEASQHDAKERSEDISRTGDGEAAQLRPMAGSWWKSILQSWRLSPAPASASTGAEGETTPASMGVDAERPTLFNGKSKAVLARSKGERLGGMTPRQRFLARRGRKQVADYDQTARDALRRRFSASGEEAANGLQASEQTAAEEGQVESGQRREREEMERSLGSAQVNEADVDLQTSAALDASQGPSQSSSSRERSGHSTSDQRGSPTPQPLPSRHPTQPYYLELSPQQREERQLANANAVAEGRRQQPLTSRPPPNPMWSLFASIRKGVKSEGSGTETPSSEAPLALDKRGDAQATMEGFYRFDHTPIIYPPKDSYPPPLPPVRDADLIMAARALRVLRPSEVAWVPHDGEGGQGRWARRHWPDSWYEKQGLLEYLDGEQSLAYLGDSLLHFVTRLLVMRRYPDRRSRDISEAARFLVSNQNYIYIYDDANLDAERMAVYELMRQESKRRQIEQPRSYNARPTEVLSAEEKLLREKTPLPDAVMPSLGSRWKQKADSFEAYVGAVYLNFGFDATLRWLELLLQPWVDRVGREENFRQNPILSPAAQAELRRREADEKDKRKSQVGSLVGWLRSWYNKG